MNREAKASSHVLKVVYEGAKDLYEAGAISAKRMAEYEAMCLEELPDYSSAKIKTLRRRNKLNQKQFASILEASLNTVKQWELGTRKPSRPYRKLLQILDRRGPAVLQP